MRKLSFVMIAVGAVFFLQACHSSADSKSAADSMNNLRDTTNMDSAKKNSASTVGMTVNGNDAKFAVDAANGGMGEVMLGKLAQEKSSNASIKKFGEMMVTDHSRVNDELRALAKSKNIALPLVVGTDEQKHYDDLSKKTGADFDKAYVSMMVDDHKTDIGHFEDAEKNLQDPDLKAFVIKTLPTLKMHLASINKIDKAMKK